MVSLGANLDEIDEHGRTPLATAVSQHSVGAARVLFELSGSEPSNNGLNEMLLDALKSTENAFISRMLEMAKLLLDHGATVTPEMTDEIQRIGEQFEFYRGVYDRDSLDETDAALRELYRLFDATPVSQRQTHDGVSPIVMPDGTWSERHAVLWEMLVPGKGKAETVQGEVIRLSGKLGHEILGNGCINWNRDFRTMLEALVRSFSEGNALDDGELTEARMIARGGKRGGLNQSEVDRLDEHAVTWVARNPEAIALPPVDYQG